jgi:hypothetical protein
VDTGRFLLLTDNKSTCPRGPFLSIKIVKLSNGVWTPAGVVSTWLCGPIGASILACWATLGAVKLWNCSLRPTHRKHYGLIFMVLSKKHLVYFALQIGSRSTGRAARQPFGGVGRGRGRGVVPGGPCSGGRLWRWCPVSYPTRASKHYEQTSPQHYGNYRGTTDTLTNLSIM